MATKPTSLARWAANANYSSGPFIGSATKQMGSVADGYVPDVPMPAEYVNFWNGKLSEWVIDWLEAGSSAGAADAHIVETNGAGRATMQEVAAIAAMVKGDGSSSFNETTDLANAATYSGVVNVNGLRRWETVINDDFFQIDRWAGGSGFGRILQLDWDRETVWTRDHEVQTRNTGSPVRRVTFSADGFSSASSIAVATYTLPQNSAAIVCLNIVAQSEDLPTDAAVVFARFNVARVHRGTGNVAGGSATAMTSDGTSGAFTATIAFPGDGTWQVWCSNSDGKSYAIRGFLDIQEVTP